MVAFQVGVTGADTVFIYKLSKLNRKVRESVFVLLEVAVLLNDR